MHYVLCPAPNLSHWDQFCIIIYGSYLVLGFLKYEQNLKTNLEVALSLLIGLMTEQNTVQRESERADRSYLKGIYIENI